MIGWFHNTTDDCLLLCNISKFSALFSKLTFCFSSYFNHSHITFRNYFIGFSYQLHSLFKILCVQHSLLSEMHNIHSFLHLSTIVHAFNRVLCAFMCVYICVCVCLRIYTTHFRNTAVSFQKKKKKKTYKKLLYKNQKSNEQLSTEP